MKRPDNNCPSIKELKSFCTINKSTGCWEWNKCRDGHGYGMITIFNKSIRAHRLMYRLTLGSNIPIGTCVCHRCDNPPCINPKHLFGGSRRDNMNDCVLKNRTARGSAVASGKLSKWQAEEILQADLKRFDRRKSYFAKRFKITVRAVSAIVKGESWKYLKRSSPKSRN